MTAHSAEVKSSTDATISCVIDEITSQVEVEWVGLSGNVIVTDNNYTPNSGTLDNNRQTATLEVKGATEDKIFVCRVKSGQFPDSNEPMSVTSVQLYVYGMFEISLKKGLLHSAHLKF